MRRKICWSFCWESQTIVKSNWASQPTADVHVVHTEKQSVCILHAEHARALAGTYACDSSTIRTCAARRRRRKRRGTGSGRVPSATGADVARSGAGCAIAARGLPRQCLKRIRRAHSASVPVGIVAIDVLACWANCTMRCSWRAEIAMSTRNAHRAVADV